MGRPLGDAGDDPQLAVLVGVGNDAFARGDADLVSAGAQVMEGNLEQYPLSAICVG